LEDEDSDEDDDDGLTKVILLGKILTTLNMIHLIAFVFQDF